MNGNPTPEPPADPKPPTLESTRQSVDETPKATDWGVLIGGTIAGFLLFLLGGFLALSMGNRGTPAAIYVFFAFMGAIALVRKPRLRGLGIGIFLGIGPVLLLISICGGFKIGG